MVKNILWIAMCPPLPTVKNAGGQTFNYYYNNFLNSGEFEITLIAKLTNKEIADSHKYSDNSKRIYIKNSTGIKRIYDLAYSLFQKLNPCSRYGNTLLKSTYRDIEIEIKKLKQIGYVPDAVILEWGQIGLFIEVAKKYFPDAKYIISEHDVMFLGKEREVEFETNSVKKFLAKIKYNNIKKRELTALNAAELIVVHNDKDKQLLEKNNFKDDKIYTIIPYYQNIEVSRTPNGKDIIFYGAMNRPENYLSAIWFIENIMPVLSSDVRFLIVGGNPDDCLKKYESQHIIITGFVDNLKPFFETCCCLVAPLVLGAGIKIKILEAVAAGIPVITNNIGIEGIPLENKKHYFHCENSSEYVDAINTILANASKAEKMAKDAKFTLIQYFNKDKSVDNYINKVKNM